MKPLSSLKVKNVKHLGETKFVSAPEKGDEKKNLYKKGVTPVKKKVTGQNWKTTFQSPAGERLRRKNGGLWL